MNSKFKIIVLYLVLSACQTVVSAGNINDSLAESYDSLVAELSQQVQELNLQRIMLQEELERSGRTARLDSAQKAHRQQRIDSLRLVTRARHSSSGATRS